MLQKQALDLAFAKGLDTKVDPKRIAFGNFDILENSIFDRGGLLQKRNGFGSLAPNPNVQLLTTYKNSLIGLGNNVSSYDEKSDTWIQSTKLQSISLNTVPLVRNAINQVFADSAVDSNGLVCTAYVSQTGSGASTKWSLSVIISSVDNGQVFYGPVVILPASTNKKQCVVGESGNYFAVMYQDDANSNLYLQTIDKTTFATATYLVTSTITGGMLWDATVYNGLFYWIGQTQIGTINIATGSITSVALSSPASFRNASLAVDSANNALYATIADPGISAYAAAFNATTLANTSGWQSLPSGTTILAALSTVAFGGRVFIFADVGGSPINIAKWIMTQSGSFVSNSVIINNLAITSRPFAVNGEVFLLAQYVNFVGTPVYQPTYFLLNVSQTTIASANVIAKLAYSNAGIYDPQYTLPSVSLLGMTAYVPYLIKDLVAAINKTNDGTGPTDGIYTQSGVNLASFTFGAELLEAVETGQNLIIPGGFVNGYDGLLATENNFHLWPNAGPNSLTNQTNTAIAVWSVGGGSIAAQPSGTGNVNQYFYQFTYEWTDNQGNTFKSAPSVPVAVTTTGNSTGKITLNIPTLTVTNKTNVKLVAYRWSTAQQVYYRVTPILDPVLNDPTVTYVTYVDTLADASITGNDIIYTTGGVVENIAPPASDIMTMFDSRLWLVSAEDRNLLWFSKQVIEATPVEMSDLFTIFVPPTISTQGSTGEITALSPMDDKLIVFKRNAIFYINGAGPDNTGNNNQYSPATFVTSNVGCSNQRSIVFMPQGLMFQSEGKGIWLLERNLNVTYIGAPVERYNGSLVTSAVLVPNTNQVRFTLDSGEWLMYDYYYGQWGTFVGNQVLSSCIYNQLHTVLGYTGNVSRETPGSYLDGVTPVNMRFKTGPINLGTLQGYQRSYFFYLLGQYLSAHNLTVSIYFDYEQSPSQVVPITPLTPAQPEVPVDGYPQTLESWRIFLSRQRCMAFAVEIAESSTGGPGLNLSGLNLVVGMKKGYRPQPAAISAG